MPFFVIFLVYELFNFRRDFGFAYFWIRASLMSLSIEDTHVCRNKILALTFDVILVFIKQETKISTILVEFVEGEGKPFAIYVRDKG